MKTAKANLEKIALIFGSERLRAAVRARRDAHDAMERLAERALGFVPYGQRDL